MKQYAAHGSHLSETIDWHLRQGWCLYYRGYQVGSKVEAVEMETRMPAGFKYDWNLTLNPDED